MALFSINISVNFAAWKVRNVLFVYVFSVLCRPWPEARGGLLCTFFNRKSKPKLTNMNKKIFYTAPEAETLVVRFEENFLNSPNGYQNGGGGSYSGDHNDNGDF